MCQAMGRRRLCSCLCILLLRHTLYAAAWTGSTDACSPEPHFISQDAAQVLRRLEAHHTLVHEAHALTLVGAQVAAKVGVNHLYLCETCSTRAHGKSKQARPHCECAPLNVCLPCPPCRP